MSGKIKQKLWEWSTSSMAGVFRIGKDMCVFHATTYFVLHVLLIHFTAMMILEGALKRLLRIRSACRAAATADRVFLDPVRKEYHKRVPRIKAFLEDQGFNLPPNDCIPNPPE
jgi:hypothetical protein